jgi:hypothetical protein
MDKEKFVDESWKEAAAAERDKLADVSPQQTVKQPEPAEGSAGQAQAVEIDFLNYVTSLGFQAMIFLGEIPNPVTNEVEKNLTQARFLIDTLAMLKEKTDGNLNDQENNLLENSIYELQMKYVEVSQQGTPPEKEKAV